MIDFTIAYFLGAFVNELGVFKILLNAVIYNSGAMFLKSL